MSHKSRNPNAREILVYEGKEITRAKMDELPDSEVTKVKKRLNGPHHNARWAIHQRQIVKPLNRFTRDSSGKIITVQLRNLVITPKP